MSKKRATRPNIVLILADDLGFSDIGCYGSEIATPSLDRLAAEGVQFTQAYGCARCAPSQASILTGLYPHQAGIGHAAAHLGHPSYQGFLSDRCFTIAEILGEIGYRTLMAGNWHVGGSYDIRYPETWRPGDTFHPTPLTRGFEHFYGTLNGCGCYYRPYTLMDDDRFVELEEIEESGRYYYTDAVTDSAVGFVTEYAPYDEPLFLFVSYTAPHWPLQAPSDDIARYSRRYLRGWDELRAERHRSQVDRGVVDDRWGLSPRDESAPAWRKVKRPEWEARRMAVYAAQIDRMDRGIGKILSALETHSDYENTLVLFLSDNGASADDVPDDDSTRPLAPTGEEDRTQQAGVMPGGGDTCMSYGLPWANVSNTPFRRFKRRVHEGGISVPLIVSWPRQAGSARPGRMVHGPVHAIDIVPSCLEAASTSYPTERRGSPVQLPEGVSFLAGLRGDSWERGEPLFWEHEGNCAVRAGEWKLVRMDGGDWELYSMAEDRTELRDLRGERPAVAAELEKMWTAWAQRCRVLAWRRMAGRAAQQPSEPCTPPPDGLADGLLGRHS